jgi:hypothetical protein
LINEMVLLHVFCANARQNGNGELCVRLGEGKAARWNLLPSGSKGREMLQLIAMACGGTAVLSHAPFQMPRFCLDFGRAMQVEIIMVVRDLREGLVGDGRRVASGIRVDGTGGIRALRESEYRFAGPDMVKMRAKKGLGASWLPLLGYGPTPKPHRGTDDFDFTNPFFRFSRFHSLFDSKALLTDPVEFLNRLRYKGVKLSRARAAQALERLAVLFKQYLCIDTDDWMDPGCDYGRKWSALEPGQQRAALPFLDATRHLLDAYPSIFRPLDLPIVLLFDRPDRFCTKGFFPAWIALLDSLLPQGQFLMTLGAEARLDFPGRLLTESLTHSELTGGRGSGIASSPASGAASSQVPVHVPSSASKAAPAAVPESFHRAASPARYPRRPVLLLDLDGRLPNLALMKLSRWLKEQGREVVLARRDSLIPDVEAVYASCIFSLPRSRQRLLKLRQYYGSSLILGGSGVDITTRLPEEVESLPADYSIYPELGNRAIGFLTRGCPFQCPFCIVPIKEGKPHEVSDLVTLMQNGRRELILLDDNILAHPRSGDFLEDMARRDLKVNFTQTLDLRLLDREKARLLKRVQCCNLKFTRRVYHFSLNDNRNLDQLNAKYRLFEFNHRDNAEFICMFGFKTTLAQDVERFDFLRSLPGAYVFMQEYQPILGGPSPDLTGFFDERADQLIEKLIHIVFTQNMKSMEKYYRWVSRLYALKFGRLHQGLVDTIFRYNKREKRGLYMATLGHTKRI